MRAGLAMGRLFFQVLPLLVELTRVEQPVFSPCHFRFQLHAAIPNRHLLSLRVESAGMGQFLAFWMVA
jgi:hypothetical protein